MTVVPGSETLEPIDGRDEPRLRIGEVARETSLTARTLRYWEEIGLLRPFAHRGSGERLYSCLLYTSRCV